jgi:uncharacterized protein YndB with AHSA1/START domain
MNKNVSNISDDAVKKATGKIWSDWFSLLDLKGGKTKTHKQIVEIIKASGDKDPWWQQMVTVEYEQTRGLRKKHEMTDGFQISKSKTIAVDAETLFNAWINEVTRQIWLDDPAFTIRKATEPKTIRITWVDGLTDVNVFFYPKTNKTQVTINHGKLPDEKSAAEMKVYWSRQLEQLSNKFK